MDPEKAVKKIQLLFRNNWRKVKAEERKLRGSQQCIYLSSAGDRTPGLKEALKVFFDEHKKKPESTVRIVCFNDANPHKKMFADQKIYENVKELIQSLGYKTFAPQPYQLFDLQKFSPVQMNKLLDEFHEEGSVCVMVGGNTWRLSHAFGQLQGLRDELRTRILRGDLAYISFSAGTVFAGCNVELCRDSLQDVEAEGGSKVKDGLKLFPQLAFRPHNQATTSQQAGQAFEEAVASGRAKDDSGNKLKCKVKYLKDGEAYLQLGASFLHLPDDKDKIDKLARKRAVQKKGIGHWEVRLDKGWHKSDEISNYFSEKGLTDFSFKRNGHEYAVDFKGLTQQNKKTNKMRPIRYVPSEA